MKFKETLIKDWKIVTGFLFDIAILVIPLISIFIYGLNVNSFLFALFLFFLVYILGFVVGLSINAVDTIDQALKFPILLTAYREASKEENNIKDYLKNFSQDVHKSAVVILAHYDRYNIKYSLKENYNLKEIKLLTEYLKLSRPDDFSFYFNATPEDVADIMFDNKVREVLFVGHGDSHTFVLSLDDDIYYCDFNDEKCHKNIIHQIHCGTRTGKSLVEYVVPLENQSENKCFYPRKEVCFNDIKKWFEKRIKELENNKK